MLVRLAMLRNLRTEWGGSEQQQLDFLHRPEHESLRDEERRELTARQLTQLAHWQLHFANDTKAAKRTAQASLALLETPYALLVLAHTSGPFKQVKILSRALELAPHDLHLGLPTLLHGWRAGGQRPLSSRACARPRTGVNHTPPTCCP
ncbi:hypothetical protein ACFFLM_26480 [Deinococcus oregonensis]|uniref:Uncharacterized protein n=1 Tax=Deinococcus oregonensis TaxID=1805970 RepID=A0ABV6BAP4_9DEIO